MTRILVFASSLLSLAPISAQLGKETGDMAIATQLIRSSKFRLARQHTDFINALEPQQDHLEGGMKGLAIELDELSSNTLRSPLHQVPPELNQEGKNKHRNLRSSKGFDIDSSASQTDSIESLTDVREHLSQPGTHPLTGASLTPRALQATASPSAASSTNGTHCGCPACTDSVWNSQAPSGAGPLYTCGTRIEWVIGTGSSEIDACSLVTGQFPVECGACSCGGLTEAAAAGNPPGSLTPDFPEYCFPPYDQRVRYTNVWGNFIVEVKENSTACGPGNNFFTSNNVQVSGSDLILQYKQNNGVWSASEVRVVLPQAQMPFNYGIFQFSVQSISVIASNGTVVSNELPPDITLGMFTWDSMENYAVHENWNHEVDIEISRWGNATNKDAQFLIQPDIKGPQWTRFFTGPDGSFDEGGHVYEINWAPDVMSWYSDANGGTSFTYTSQIAQETGTTDYIQCLPANIEIRINLWNYLGPVQPTLESDQYVEVVIDNFSYTPSGVEYAPDGAYCSKNCQCGPTSYCVSGICAAQ